jgi:diguanylate cyclase (GGDEF)-like protein
MRFIARTALRPTDEQHARQVRTRVLVVDEEDRGGLVLTELIRVAWPEGVILLKAARLTDAIQELLDHGPACVLLTPPADEGLVAVEQLTMAAPDAPVIIVADELDERSVTRLVAAGAQDHLVRRELTATGLRRAVAYAMERKRLEGRLTHQALHDPLTGLPNRALFLDRLGMALDRAQRNRTTVAVLFLDVDNFKAVNDSLGHAAGDRLLTALADRLRAVLRPMDTVARFGGDEFMLLFEDLSGEREAAMIAERVSYAAASPITLEDDEAKVTVSIGVAVVADPSIPAEHLLREADAAMYRAKELGRSKYTVSDAGAKERMPERAQNG